MNPIVFLISLISAWIVTLAFAWCLIRIGWRGIRGGPFPLTKEKQITGATARVAGLFMASFGGLVCLIGVVVIPLCAWGIWKHAAN